MTTALRNVLAIYGQATAEERAAGATWYPRANAVAGHLAAAHEQPLCVVVGVIAALSPSNRWARNLVDAAVVLQGGAKVATYGQQLQKAQRILGAVDTEEVIDILGAGLKTRAFFWNILCPAAQDHVTVDGHAVCIAAGKKGAIKRLPAITKTQYSHLVGIYRGAARLAGVSPTTMQATTWVTWRRIHGIG